MKMETQSLANQTAQADDVVLDSLPYAEAVHEDYEEYALAMIEEEMKLLQPRPQKMPALQFRTPMMQREYETLVVDHQFVSRPERSFQPLKIARPTTSLEEWTTIAIPQAKTRFETERIRSMILEAEKEEAVPNWKDYNTSLEHLESQWSTALERQREAVAEINYQRQQAQQQQLGPQLEQLNAEYQQALYRRNQLQHAIEGLRRQGISQGDGDATSAEDAS